jgi:hypothetical protein
MSKQIKPKFYGTVEKGTIKARDVQGLRMCLQKFEGKEVEFTVAPKYKRRTQGDIGEDTNFNGYWWAVIIRIISDEMGEPDDNVTHNLLQMIFNKRGIRSIDPETKKIINVEVPRGTRHLSGGEFADLCSRVRMWAAMPGNLSEKGVFIPEPNEIEYPH